MKYVRDGDLFLIRLAIGEEFVDSLTEFAKTEKLGCGTFQAIGAFGDFELGYYLPDTKKYLRQNYSENVEIVNCAGNIALKEGSPFVHAHVTLGRSDYSLLGGHLFRGIVSVTAEIALHKIQRDVQRVYEEDTALFLLDL